MLREGSISEYEEIIRAAKAAREAKKKAEEEEAAAEAEVMGEADEAAKEQKKPKKRLTLWEDEVEMEEEKAEEESGEDEEAEVQENVVAASYTEEEIANMTLTEQMEKGLKTGKDIIEEARKKANKTKFTRRLSTDIPAASRSVGSRGNEYKGERFESEDLWSVRRTFAGVELIECLSGEKIDLSKQWGRDEKFVLFFFRSMG